MIIFKDSNCDKNSNCDKTQIVTNSKTKQKLTKQEAICQIKQCRFICPLQIEIDNPESEKFGPVIIYLESVKQHLATLALIIIPMSLLARSVVEIDSPIYSASPPPSHPTRLSSQSATQKTESQGNT